MRCARRDVRRAEQRECLWTMSGSARGRLWRTGTHEGGTERGGGETNLQHEGGECGEHGEHGQAEAAYEEAAHAVGERAREREDEEQLAHCLLAEAPP
eukprot:7337359-Prymnesium_polylepis.2